MRIAILAMLTGVLACARPIDWPVDGRWGPLVATLEVKVTPWSARLVYHVTNGGDEPVRLTFPSSQRYDIVVSTPSGEAVWRWSDGKRFQPAIMRAVLRPGETWEMTGTWDFGSRTGQYVATGSLLANGGPLETAAGFEVP